jgi:hypothetical protein
MALNTLPNAGLTNRGYPSDRIVTPIIINGDMSVAQRATSVTGVTSGTYKTVDRFRLMISSAGTWTVSQSTTVPTGQGFNKSFKLDCTTADASLGAGDILGMTQKIEGFNQAPVKKGTANAEKTTLVFWVRSNKTGTYICELFDDQNTRQVSKSYTIDSANTWEKKVIVFPADTSGANDFDNTAAMQVNWWLAMGSDYTSGTLSETWTATTSANRAVGQVNLADSTSNEWYVTGVQLEVGEFDSTSVPSFPFESYANNLQKCFRYYELLASGNALTLGFGGTYNANAPAYAIYYHPKRAVPSLDEVNSSNYYRFYSSGVEYKYNVSSQFFQATITQAMVINGNAGTVADDKVGFFDTINSGAYLALDAEL